MCRVLFTHTCTHTHTCMHTYTHTKNTHKHIIMRQCVSDYIRHLAKIHNSSGLI